MNDRKKLDSEVEIFNLLKEHLPEKVYNAYVEMGVDNAIIRLKDLRIQGKTPYWANAKLMGSYSAPPAWFKDEIDSPDTILKKLLDNTPHPETIYKDLYDKMLESTDKLAEDIAIELDNQIKEERSYYDKYVGSSPQKERYKQVEKYCEKYTGKRSKIQDKQQAVVRCSNALNVEKTKKESNLDFYKARIEEACDSLRKERTVTVKGKVIASTDFELIQGKRSSFTRFLENVFQAIKLLNPKNAKNENNHSKQYEGHAKFWKSKEDSSDKPIKEVENFLGLTPRKTR